MRLGPCLPDLGKHHASALSGRSREAKEAGDPYSSNTHQTSGFCSVPCMPLFHVALGVFSQESYDHAINRV